MIAPLAAEDGEFRDRAMMGQLVEEPGINLGESDATSPETGVLRAGALRRLTYVGAVLVQLARPEAGGYVSSALLYSSTKSSLDISGS